MIKRVVFAGLVLLLGFGILPVSAQDAPTTLPLPKIFCMGQIQFNYPLGWAVDTEYADGTPGAEFIYAANSASEFAGGFYTPNPAQGNVIVFVGALNASYILQSYNVAADSPEAVLNGIFESMPSFDRPQTSAIQSFDLNGHPAARADLHDETTEGVALVVQYGDDQFGLLRFVTPLDEASRWESTALAIFETVNIAKNAPCSTPLDQTFTTDDGSFSFQYPSGWTAETDMPRLSISVGNLPKNVSLNQIQAGKIDGTIFPNESYDEICARFGMCSWVGLINVTPDTVLDGFTTFFDGEPGITVSREKAADHDILYIYTQGDPVDNAAYIVQTDDIFTVLFFSGKPVTLAQNASVFSAMINSLRYQSGIID